jgi:hypothetical protein
MAPGIAGRPWAPGLPGIERPQPSHWGGGLSGATDARSGLLEPAAARGDGGADDGGLGDG